ncbi:MAG: YggT family protein [Anaerolineae bacterium]|nr:YggT family protein [Anaerolineae bacterium]
MIETLLRVIDVILGTIGLLLVIRALLVVFRVSGQHPVLRLLTVVTDPLITVIKGMLGIPSYTSLYLTSPIISSRILDPIIALVAVWIVRTVLVWAAGLALVIPVWVGAPLAHIGDLLQYVLRLVFSMYTGALFLRIILQWLQVPYSSGIMRFLWSITEPVLAPIRQVLPPMMGFDLSPLIVYFLLRLLEGVLLTLVSWVF